MTAAQQAEERARRRAQERASQCAPPPPDAEEIPPPPPGNDIPPIGEDDAPPADKPRRPGARQVAARYLAERASHRDGVTLRRWRGNWYRWNATQGSYVEQTEERIDVELWNGLPVAKRSELADIKTALTAMDGVLIDEFELGSWLDGSGEDGDPLDTAPCCNGLLHLPTGRLTPATPRYFSTSSLGVPYNPAAPSPERWLAFLRQLWPESPDSIEALQEWCGYLLTPDTRQQKIALLVGPKRSGKGTIARVLTALLGGDRNVASPTLASLGGTFGLWPLIGKPAAIIGDARLGGRNDIAQVVERLLSISGEDSQTIDRKNRSFWTGRLPTRITIISNELPRFSDASDALPSRMLMLELSESFYGREDMELTGKLSEELPGILLWAIEGWRRLRARGHFVQPESSKESIEELADLASPVGAWARQRCDTGAPDPQWWLECKAAYEDFARWCEQNGHHKPSIATFGRDVRASTGCHRKQIRRGTTRVKVYVGLALRSDS
jgi:putative DNA primase/helicase